MNSKALLLAAPFCLLAGCATHYSPGVGQFDQEAFGEANRQTYAAMIIDPDPQYDEAIEYDGEVAADAVERYRDGEVEEPSGQGVGGGSGGGSGGGNSSGGGGNSR